MRLAIRQKVVQGYGAASRGDLAEADEILEPAFREARRMKDPQLILAAASHLGVVVHKENEEQRAPTTETDLHHRTQRSDDASTGEGARS